MADPKHPRLPPGQQLVAHDKWPLVGEAGPSDSAQPWSLSISGCVQHCLTWDLNQLRSFPQTRVTIDIHCVTRWSKYDVSFAGVMLEHLLQRAGIREDARFVSFVARSNRNHSSSLPLAEARQLGALIAHSVDGRPLPSEHGGPIRGIVPGKYFYKSVKWIEKIELLSGDRLGFWESDNGYHNGADPWQEQRFIAHSLSKREAAKIIGSRDLTGRVLLSLDASQRDLTELQAQGATLRNANFSGCQLTRADFRQANLSNANFRFARLVNADFTHADLEGADFAGSDLRGAVFHGCSLFGATFCDADPQRDQYTNGAKLDRTSRLPESLLGALAVKQLEYINRCLP